MVVTRACDLSSEVVLTSARNGMKQGEDSQPMIPTASHAQPVSPLVWSLHVECTDWQQLSRRPSAHAELWQGDALWRGLNGQSLTRHSSSPFAAGSAKDCIAAAGGRANDHSSSVCRLHVVMAMGSTSTDTCSVGAAASARGTAQRTFVRSSLAMAAHE